MVSQYPHTMSRTTVEIPTEPYQDENDDWVIPEPGAQIRTEVTFKANASPNGKGSRLKTKDGELLEFAFLVKASMEAPKLIVGETVTIKNGSDHIYTGPVLGYFRGQLAVSIWV